MSSEGDRWQLLLHLEEQAEELESVLKTVKDEHNKCCHEANCKHGKLLREEYERVTEQRRVKEEQMNKLTDSLIDTTLREAGHQTLGTPAHQRPEDPAAQKKAFNGFNFGIPSAQTTPSLGAPSGSMHPPRSGSVATQPRNVFGLLSPAFGVTSTDATHPAIGLFGSAQQAYTEPSPAD